MDTAKRAAVPYRNPPSETMPSPEKAPLPLPRPDQHRHAGAPLPTSQRLSRCLVARAAATRPASLPSCPQITLSAKGMPGRSVFGIWRATRRSLCCSHCLIFRENLLLITASPDDPADAATPDKSSLFSAHSVRPWSLSTSLVHQSPHEPYPETHTASPRPSLNPHPRPRPAASGPPARNNQEETRSPAVLTSNPNLLPHPLL